MELTVVICHFKEDLSWVKDIKHKVVIYNKNPEHNNLYEINLPNVGFDTIVYLKYIIDNYDNLPDYVCFSQDDPFYHCPRFIEKVNEFDFIRKFHPLGISYIRSVDNIVKDTISYADSVGIKYELPIKFINSAQCIVSRELILMRNKESYQRIKDSIPNQIISQTNYLIEYLWPTILNFNNELEVSRLNC
jgi:hypothetical protein